MSLWYWPSVCMTCCESHSSSSSNSSWILFSHSSGDSTMLESASVTSTISVTLTCNTNCRQEFIEWCRNCHAHTEILLVQADNAIVCIWLVTGNIPQLSALVHSPKDETDKEKGHTEGETKINILLKELYLVVLIHIIKSHHSIMMCCLLQNVFKCVVFHLCPTISIIHGKAWLSWQCWWQFPYICCFRWISNGDTNKTDKNIFIFELHHIDLLVVICSNTFEPLCDYASHPWRP